MSFDLSSLQEAVREQGEVVRILVLRAAGSTPRGAGTSMLVWATGQSGTIGGGALEFAAVRTARGMLMSGAGRRLENQPLGPSIGQCCGGAVRLVWERFSAGTVPGTLPYARPLAAAGDMPSAVARRLSAVQAGHEPIELEGWLIESAPMTPRPLWIWGAGHVGRALVGVLALSPDFAITWVDTGLDRFPEPVAGVTMLPAPDPSLAVSRAPRDGEHIILTYSHEIDLALCHRLLVHGFAGCGLIGSATKWARFRSRLAALGHSAEQIARIACPIGDPSLGKHPQAIALGVATSLLKRGATKTDWGTDRSDKYSA